MWKDSIVSEKTHNIENKITVGDSRKSTIVLPNSKTFKEKFELYHFAGAVFIVSGIYLSNKKIND